MSSNRWRRAKELTEEAGIVLSDHSCDPFSDERIAEIASSVVEHARAEVARVSRRPGSEADFREMERAPRLAVGLLTAERKERAS